MLEMQRLMFKTLCSTVTAFSLKAELAYLSMKRKAVSDIVGAVILIMIVVVIFGGIVYPLLTRYQSSSSNVLSSQQKAEVQSQVLVSPIYATTSGSTTYVYFYNYGKTLFTPSEFIINGQTINAFTLIDQQNGSPVSTVVPGTVTEVELPGVFNSPFNISVVGNGVTLSWEV